MNPTVAALIALDEAIAALFMEEGVIRVDKIAPLLQAGKQATEVLCVPYGNSAVNWLVLEAQVCITQTVFCVRSLDIKNIFTNLSWIWAHRQRYHELVQLLRERDEEVGL